MKDNIKVALSVTGVALGAYFCYLSKLYGTSGAVRFLWEGDHLTSIQRDNLNKLTKCSRKLNAIAKRVIEIQRYLELERLKSSDDDNSTSDGIIAFPIDGGIRKKVGILSSDLDWLASRIDSVATKHNDAQSTEEIILTKKALSRRTVKLMNYVDELMEILLEADKSFRALKNEASVFYTHTQT